MLFYMIECLKKSYLQEIPAPSSILLYRVDEATITISYLVLSV